ncbi:MAG: HAMP domain-containing sensor histidine kinase [Bacillota bacterium]|nr:HAMP domain-containing sensor histidine kinase [Bacillota bacterium]
MSKAKIMQSADTVPQQDRQYRAALYVLFSTVVFCLFLTIMAVVVGAVVALIHLNVLRVGTAHLDLRRLILYIALASIILGALLSAIVSRYPLRPVYQVIEAVNRLSAGDFKTRLQFGKWLRHNPAMKELSSSFNKMAEELENTEMLRSDFVNAFSHEFKTPIVSIAGFAALLKRGNLTPAQQQEYLDAIEEESLRLSAMATNVLNLSKVENQAILRDVTTFNLSEQIRSCVLLLENQWSKKHLELNLDFDEYIITANEELLKQVWINLIDNAVKFTPAYGMMKIAIEQDERQLSVSVTNTGSTIPPESMERIFQKFYQADASRATAGNGVGLAIVKKVAELHQGSVRVASQQDITTFTVTLPTA